MIGRLFVRIFGSRPVQTTAAEAAPTPSAPAETFVPQDLVSEPTLPLEPGFHYTTDGRKGQSPKLLSTNLEHLWSGELHREDFLTDLRLIGSRFSRESERGVIKYDPQRELLSYAPHSARELKGRTLSHHKGSVMSAEFTASEDGKVSIPSARNLEGGKNMAQKRELAKQSQDLIKYSEAVRTASVLELDQGEFDHDLRPGRVVADNVNDYRFIAKSNLERLQPGQTYSVESGPENLRVFLDNGNRPHLVLEARTEGSRTEIQQAFCDGKRSLHLDWDEPTGVLKAEVREDLYGAPHDSRRQPLNPDEDGGHYPRRAAVTRDDRYDLPSDFTASKPTGSYGGGPPHVMVDSPMGNFHDRNFPEKFVDKETGKTYGNTSYGLLGGSRMYIEQ
jgi:hypothetical protein